MPRQPRPSTTRAVLIVLAAVAVGCVALTGSVLAAGYFAVAYAFSGGGGYGAPTTAASGSLRVSELTYDQATRTVTGTLVGTRSSDYNQPVTVTIAAAVPGRPAVVATAKATEQNQGQSVRVRLELTDEQARAFADPAARRTVSVQGNINGQVIVAERDWPTDVGGK